MASRSMEDRVGAILAEVVRCQKQGQPRALYSACSANAFVIRAVLQQALKNGATALIAFR